MIRGGFARVRVRVMSWRCNHGGLRLSSPYACRSGPGLRCLLRPLPHQHQHGNPEAFALRLSFEQGPSLIAWPLPRSSRRERKSMEPWRTCTKKWHRVGGRRMATIHKNEKTEWNLPISRKKDYSLVFFLILFQRLVMAYPLQMDYTGPKQ